MGDCTRCNYKYKVSSVAETSCTAVDTVACMYTLLSVFTVMLLENSLWCYVHRMHNYVYDSVHYGAPFG